MASNVIAFPPQQQPLQPPAGHTPIYELYWMKDGKENCASSSDPAQIVRMMERLALARIPASVYADGFPAGFVGLQERGEMAAHFFGR